MRRQSINNQMQWFLSAIHQLAQQVHEQFSRETTFIGCEPKSTFGIDGGRCADALALARSVNHRRFATHGPCLSVHRISTEARLIPKINFGLLCFSLLGDCRVRLTLPTRDRFGVTLVSALKRLLR